VGNWHLFSTVERGEKGEEKKEKSAPASHDQLPLNEGDLTNDVKPEIFGRQWGP